MCLALLIFTDCLYDPLINNIYNSNVSFAGENGLINVSESNASADVKFSDSYGKFTVDLTKKLKFQLSGHYNDDLTNQELQDEIAEGEINISYTTEMFWKNYGGSAGFKYTLSPKLSIRSQLSFGDFLNTSNSLQENFDMVVNETQTLQSGLSINLQELNQKTQVEFAFSDSLKILAGLEFSNHELKQQERSFGFLLDERTDSKRTQSGFIENMFGWKKTKTTLGLRISKYDGNLYNSPRIKSSIKLTNTISAYAAFGKHYQFLRKIIPLNIFAGTIDQWELAGEDTPLVNQ